MTGLVTVVGLGPGDDQQITPAVSKALAKATDVVGYISYVARLTPRPGLTLHASDNRVETERACQALDLALANGNVVIVSSGDPGVFAMAAAVLEVLEADPERWVDVDVSVLPGITAMLAAAAKSSAWQARSASTRLSEAWRVRPGRGATRPT